MISFIDINLTFENFWYDMKASTGEETLILLVSANGAMMNAPICALMGSSEAIKQL